MVYRPARIGVRASLAASTIGLALSVVGGASPANALTMPNASSHPGVTAKTIKIGLITSITGPASSSFGQNTVNGALAAIQQVNAHGGINGRKLSLVTAD